MHVAPMAILLIVTSITRSGADAFVVGPMPPPGPIPRPTETGTGLPFLASQMRYQQVYNASLFTNVDTNLIYVTTLTFPFNLTLPNTMWWWWTISKMQIDLSTTTNAADGLNPIFQDNVGLDDTIVFGPTNHTFQGGVGQALFVPLDRPFRYSPARGNLLVDIRTSGESLPPYESTPTLDAFNSPTDEVSRVWATNVMAVVADAMDTTGLLTAIQFSPIPSLRAEFRPHPCDGCPTNVIQISWPSQPSVFQLQRADRLGSNTVWMPVTNQVSGSPQMGGWFIWVPLSSAGFAGFYRLIWPSGQ